MARAVLLGDADGRMIELHYWPTPNGWKVSVALEELGLPYSVHPVNIGRGAQFSPGFLAMSPNNRIPAIRDLAPPDGGPPISVFESGAILEYLAERTGRLCPSDVRGRAEVRQWLHWQMSGLGPMSGQAVHFRRYAPEPVAYAIDRYTREVNRLYGVLDRRLAERPFVAGEEYTIADIAIAPWIVGHARAGQTLSDFPHLERWYRSIEARPAFARGIEVGKDLRIGPAMDDEARRMLFGQTAAGVQAAANAGAADAASTIKDG